MAKACCVCSEVKESKENVLFNCKGHGCDVTVHQGCYGIVTMPSGLWFCRKCESQERAARVRCELCPKKEGALKRTDLGGWAHVVCALYIPEVTFGNNRFMEPIVTSKLPKERFTKSCYICEEKGKEMQSTYGACMSCHKSSCRLAFHVTCAQREHLLCEEQDSRDSRNVTYCGYCSNHHKKMMRQKSRQIKQQQSAPASSGSAPLPITPTSPTTPLSAVPPDVSLSEEVSSRDVGHAMERTASGSPIKVTNKRMSLSEVPGNQKRPPLPSSSSSTTSEVLLSGGSAPQKGGKQRRRKPSSSNDSSTSEAPSNASDVAVVPPTSSSGPGSTLPNPSPSSLLNHMIPVSPAPLLPPAKASHKVQLRDEDARGAGMAITEVSVVKMESTCAGDQDDVMEQMLEVSDSRTVVSGLPESKVLATPESLEQGSRQPAPPPRSLQELLERQWEQTAQFILDQAGKQNNAGSMLAHLHTLQTENRQMQSRIMELASQREFYLAINTKLRQTLTEHDLGRLPNGIQAIETGAQHHAANSAQEPMEVSGLAHHRLPRPLTPPSPQLSNSLPREDQESLLHAHFSSSATPLPNSRLQASRGNHAHSNAMSESPSRQQHCSHPQQVPMGVETGSHPHASNFLSTFTPLPPQVTSHSLPAIGPPPSLGVAILPSSRGPVEYGSRIPAVPPGDTTLHEVTQVTHSIQAPISSLTPLPNEGGCG